MRLKKPPFNLFRRYQVFLENCFCSRRAPFEFIDVPPRNIQSKALYTNFCYYVSGKQVLNMHFSKFGTLKVCRTLYNYFGHFVWIKNSHYNSCVSLRCVERIPFQRLFSFGYILWRLAYLLYGSVGSLPSPSSNIEAWPYGTSLRFASHLHLGD